MVYGEIGASLGRSEMPEIGRTTRGCLQYGVRPELIPLASLRLPQLGRARCRALYESGIRTLEQLADKSFTLRSTPKALDKWIPVWSEQALKILQAKRRINAAPAEEQRKEIDDFLSSFRVDQLRLFSNVPRSLEAGA